MVDGQKQTMIRTGMHTCQ